jgi:hypothetical protein
VSQKQTREFSPPNGQVKKYLTQLVQQSEKTFRSFNKVLCNHNTPCAVPHQWKALKGHCLHIAFKHYSRPEPMPKRKQRSDFRPRVVSNQATAAIGCSGLTPALHTLSVPANKPPIRTIWRNCFTFGNRNGTNRYVNSAKV